MGNYRGYRTSITCCKDCPDRKPGVACHDTCEKYKEQKQTWLEQKNYMKGYKSSCQQNMYKYAWTGEV